uniref:Uncharacterized protein n=1 Tax=Trichuris muris TaxID=70415 RepID=A0A5S6QJY2_TRIMR
MLSGCVFLKHMSLLEQSEINNYFSCQSESGLFTPLEYKVLRKALDLSIFTKDLQRLINTPIAFAPKVTAAQSSSSALTAAQDSKGSSGEQCTSQKRQLSHLFNFETISKRKWLKNILLEFESSTELDSLMADNVDIILKLHKYRRRVQRDCLADILNSQYTYYSSGLLSEYDRYPEHRKFILDQYGYNIPLQQASTTFKQVTKRRRATVGKSSAAKDPQDTPCDAEFLLTCPCSPNTCRCASVKLACASSVDPSVFHQWGMIAAHEFPKAFQQWRVASIYRQSVLKNLAISSVTHLTKGSQKGQYDKGKHAYRTNRRSIRGGTAGRAFPS